MMSKRILPPTWLLISILLMVGMHLVLPLTYLIPPGLRLFGLIPLILGVALNLIADWVLHQLGTTVNPFEEPAALATGSVFQISRNPMYLGFLLILAGLALLLGSLSPFLVIILFFFWIDWAYIRYEEQAMKDRFGPVWLQYKEKTRRWI